MIKVKVESLICHKNFKGDVTINLNPGKVEDMTISDIKEKVKDAYIKILKEAE
jgi:site-specific DNA-adenine methylase